MSRYDDVLQNYLFFNQYNEWQKVKIKQIKLNQMTIYVDIQSIITLYLIIIYSFAETCKMIQQTKGRRKIEL